MPAIPSDAVNELNTLDAAEAKETKVKKAPKKAAKKAAKAKGKKAPKAKKAKAERAPREKGPNDLTGNEQKVLKTLKGTSKGGKELTRQQLAERTGIAKGWSKMLGAATKEDGGTSGDNSLEGRGFIGSVRREGSRSISYFITAKGQNALDKAQAKA